MDGPTLIKTNQILNDLHAVSDEDEGSNINHGQL